MMQTEQIHRLRSVLKDAEEKLLLYRQTHTGEYVGGVEYATLMKQIADVLAECRG